MSKAVTEEQSLLFSEAGKRAMNVLVFGSGTGSNLKALLSAQPDPASQYSIRAVVSDRPCTCLDIAREHGVLEILHDFKAFFRARGVKDFRDPQLRRAYDEEVLRRIRELEAREGFNTDFIVLAGYMRLLYPPLLEAFPNRILNVHPADLQAFHSDGSRKYIGADAVYDALCAGEKQTRSTVILVNEEVDGGELVVLGPWVKYGEGEPVTRESADRHQEKQKRLSDWPALVTAVQKIANGDLKRQVTGLEAFDMQRETSLCVVSSG